MVRPIIYFLSLSLKIEVSIFILRNIVNPQLIRGRMIRSNSTVMMNARGIVRLRGVEVSFAI